MDDVALCIRQARPEDAADLARIYIDSWHDTYPGILGHRLLGAMSLKGHTARFRAAAKGPGMLLLAEQAGHGPVGLAGLGAARDKALGFDGEIYTLYVDPAFLGQGVGRALMAGAFQCFTHRRMHSCLVWAHAKNPACFFYEAMGGRRVAARTTHLLGEATPEIGFGWKGLAALRQNRPVL
jgi:GNAT superfamily N-acetyltransferase